MQLIADLKCLIQEIKDEERESQQLGQREKYSGLCFARVQLEVLLEKHGHIRPTSLDSQSGKETT